MANHDVDIAESSKDSQEECDEPAAGCEEAPNCDEKVWNFVRTGLIWSLSLLNS